jgi:hypothetical protein
MSVYQINKILYETDNDGGFRKRLKEEPEAVLKGFRLTEEELAALTSGAVGKLFQMGVHRDNYLARIREGMAYDPRFEQGKMPPQYFVEESK